ncbi:MAG: hypothetical protein IT245_03160 [Bacteroidia bacterium]|nr:hypothetical protein [Bacteroidia bacterium]
MKSFSWILVLPLILLSSCFEFIEEISFDGEESGTCEYTLNCSQSRLKLKNIIKLDTFMGYTLPNQNAIEKDLNKVVEILSISKGITNVQRSFDFDQFIFSIQFHFDSVKNLNLALNQIAHHERIKYSLPFVRLYEKENGVFKRNTIPDDTLFKKVDKKHFKLFDDATITSIYRFQNTVESTSNSKAIISKNKKAVFLKHNIKELTANPSLLSNSIKLK